MWLETQDSSGSSSGHSASKGSKAAAANSPKQFRPASVRYMTLVIHDSAFNSQSDHNVWLLFVDLLGLGGSYRLSRP